MPPHRVVIIGNGIAGISVASKLRTLEPDASRLSVTILTREPFDYYARIRLPEVFASGLGPHDLEVYRPGWYEGKQIDVRKGCEAARLDLEARTVTARAGSVTAYDALVLCTGADSWKPPVANSDLEGIFTIREYGDADAIRSYIGTGTRHAVVIGGGLLGLEAARFLQGPESGSGASQGVESVTVIEIMDRLMPKQLDPEGSRILRRTLEGPGLRFALGAEVREFIGEGRVRGVRLRDGRELPAETVLFSAGIVPRIGLAREAGLAVRKGVIVDERLRTTGPDIWAAGDVAEFQGIVWGIIPAALEQAPVAAAAILGRAGPAYRQTIPQNSLKVAGIHVASYGRVDAEEGRDPGIRVFTRSDEAAGRYEKYVVEEGKLVGCILLGSRTNQQFAAKRIGTPVTEEEIRERLAQA
jgi:nitrite reductase (NADH) large subunit